MKILPMLFMSLCSTTIVAGRATEPAAMFTVRVVDEQGSRLTNAEVFAGFVQSIKPGWGWGGGREKQWQGITDTNGLCVVAATCEGEAGIAARKDGYYWSSGYKIRFDNVIGTVDKKWQPWNPVVDIVLKRIGNPIPMYARCVRGVKIPKDGEVIGFDLQKCDWIAPYGKGEVGDFLFRLDRKPEREITRYWGKKTRPQTLYDVSLSVFFSNSDDGLKSVPVPHRVGRSLLRLPPTAPDNGYATNLVKRILQEEDKPFKTDLDDDQNYFFRIRTRKDKDQRIVGAFYGKLHGDLRFDRFGVLEFMYYLNPTSNDRNVEFDPKLNLFKDISSLEQVREP